MANGDGVGGPANPLTETDLADINRALERLRAADELVQRAKQAGIDTTPFETRAREVRDKLGRIKQSFFPGS